MKTIFYGVLGTAAIHAVKIAPDASINDLRCAIFDHERADPNFPYCKLELYIPENPTVGDDRLRGDNDIVQAFLRGASEPFLGFKRLAPFDFLNDPTCFGPDFTLRPREIHVLVQLVQSSSPNKRQRVDSLQWVVSEGEYPPGDVKTNSQWDSTSNVNREWVTVPGRFVHGSGFPAPKSKDLILYKRFEMRDQWTMIQTCTMDAEAALYIVGSPGSGKSCAAYAFACSQVDRGKWVILWIHTDVRFRTCHCVKFDGVEKATAVVAASTMAADIEEILNGLQRPERGLIVFYDGFVESLEPVCAKILEWQSLSPSDRRFVGVSSMVSLGKWHKPETLDLLPTPPSWPPELSTGTWQTSLRMIMKFMLLSWTLDEYVEAIQYDPFFKSVKPILTDDSATEPPTTGAASGIQMVPTGIRSQHVMAKYDIAGGSARLMFGITSKDVIAILDDSINLAGDICAVAENTIGLSAGPAVNRLYAHYFRHNRIHTELVSMYVARIAMELTNGALIETCQRLLTVNPALDGHLLEGWFLLSIATTGVKYTDQEDRTKRHEWKPCDSCIFDPTADPFFLIKGWNIPRLWNQAGYDAVLWEVKPASEQAPEERRLLFVQMTRAKTHKFDPVPFLLIVNQFSSSRLQSQTAAESGSKPPVDQIDLYFVVPEANLDSFTAPVSSKDFYTRVIKASTINSNGVKYEVRVVGVPYRMQQNMPGVSGVSAVALPAAFSAQRHVFNQSVDANQPRR